MTSAQDFSREQLNKLGAYIRDQRTRSRLSLRQLAELANVSNPYLSQIERGMHEPSVRVLKAIAAGLDLSADVLLAEAGLLERVGGRPAAADPASPGTRGGADGEPASNDVERAVNADPHLGSEQKAALIQVYRSYLGATEAPSRSAATAGATAADPAATTAAERAAGPASTGLGAGALPTGAS